MSRLIVALIFVLTPSLGWTQSVAPDDRYKGYPRELIQWPKAPPTLEEIKECQAQEFYEPADYHLEKYAGRLKASRIRVQETSECTWMLTAHTDPAKRWRLVMRPAGTKVAQDEHGRDLYDLGSPTGKSCYNPRPFAWPILPPPTPAPVVPVLPLDFREKLVTGVYVPKYVEPEVEPIAVVVPPAPEGNGWFCSGKKGFLCAAVAACVIGQVWKGGFCGITIGDKDTPPTTPLPPSVVPPPPNTTPAKPPG